MSGTTDQEATGVADQEAINALAEVLTQEFALDETGEGWLEDWPARKGRGGETRSAILSKRDGKAHLRGLLKKVRQNQQWLAAIARMENKASGSTDEPTISAAVLDEFEEILSSEPPEPSEARTPFCT